MFASWVCWVVILAAPVISIVPDLAVAAVRRLFWPTLLTKVRREVRYEIQDDKSASSGSWELVEADTLSP